MFPNFNVRGLERAHNNEGLARQLCSAASQFAASPPRLERGQQDEGEEQSGTNALEYYDSIDGPSEEEAYLKGEGYCLEHWVIC